MTLTPRFDFLPGTEITLLHRPMAVTGIQETGYSVVGLDDGMETVVPFDRFVEHLKLPGARINFAQAATGDRLRRRLGGFSSTKALKNKKQQALGQFHFAMCQAVDIFVALTREEEPDFVPSIRKLGTDAARTFIAAQTTLLLGKRVYIKPPRGGEGVKGIALYKGRTICEYYLFYKELDPEERCADALVTLQHLRGNRSSRIHIRLRHLMTEAWETIGLDKRNPSVANVHDHLSTLIATENRKRILNDLPKLVIPSERTLRKHRDSLVTQTEYAIAVSGRREARNRKGRGSTDIRSLMIGELCGMDEQKMSLVTSAKQQGFWHTLSEDAKKAYDAADDYIRKRLHLIVMFDVASRMPLAWIITENPNAEATLALLRMATRDKTREKIRYGCMNEAASGCGLLYLRNDNGAGLRNKSVISSLMGLGTINGITRTYSPTDRAHDERFFGTIEACFFKVMPGYTGRRPGDIPGYDAIRNGVVFVQPLFEMVTRYLIDEYPFEKHYGIGMYGRRPWDVYQQINETRGQMQVPDPNNRRIHLGWEVSVTPSDEGVRVFEGIWFNSHDLQIAIEEHFHKGKVQVFVDPDNLSLATVIIPGVRDPIEVILQTTVFADMTLGEVLQLVAEYRREDPAVTEIYNDRLVEARSRRYADISAIGVEHDLPRSYSTIEECKTLAKAVFAGARIVRTKQLAGTTALQDVTSLGPGNGVYVLGEGPSVADAAADEALTTSADVLVDTDFTDVPPTEPLAESTIADAPKTESANPPTTKRQSMKFARPANLKEMK